RVQGGGPGPPGGGRARPAGDGHPLDQGRALTPAPAGGACGPGPAGGILTRGDPPPRAARRMTAMDQDRVAAALAEIGTLLELRGENRFRPLAYHNAARAVESLEGDLGELVAQGKLGQVRGIGATIGPQVTALVRTGTLEFLEELRQTTPAGLLQML